MQKLKFETDNGVITLSDDDTGSVNGSWRRLWLREFDGNSQSIQTDAAECIDLPGQRTLKKRLRAKTITAKIAFASLYRENGVLVSGGDPGMYALRREVLNLFPVGAAGTLTYINNSGAYNIEAYVSDTPKPGIGPRGWAEATVYFTADYPYWERLPVTSGSVEVSAGGTELIEAAEGADISSPFELFVTVGEAVTSSYETLTCAVYENGSINWHKQVSTYAALEAGTELKYRYGIAGETMCYKKINGVWTAAPSFISYNGRENALRNGPGPTTIAVSMIRASAGTISAYAVFHNIVTAV